MNVLSYGLAYEPRASKTETILRYLHKFILVTSFQFVHSLRNAIKQDAACAVPVPFIRTVVKGDEWTSNEARSDGRLLRVAKYMMYFVLKNANAHHGIHGCSSHLM